MFQLESIGGHFAKTIILFQAFAWEIKSCLSFIRKSRIPRPHADAKISGYSKVPHRKRVKSAYNQSNVSTPFEHPQIAYGLIEHKWSVNGLILCCLGNADKDIMYAHFQYRWIVSLSVTECRQQKPGWCVPWSCGEMQPSSQESYKSQHTSLLADEGE